jgi:predicted Zn-dependent peptidase
MVSGHPAERLDVPAELEKLYDLKQRGILTEEEFRARKTRLLNT